MPSPSAENPKPRSLQAPGRARPAFTPRATMAKSPEEKGDEGKRRVVGGVTAEVPKTLAPPLLPCPFRQLYPLRFNIRSSPSCCHGFSTVSQVIQHIRSSHSDGEEGTTSKAVPEFKLTSHDLDQLLDEGKSDAEIWSRLYTMLFQRDAPTPYRYDIIEHFEHYHIQSECLATFALHLPELLGAPQDWKGSPVGWVTEALRQFVSITYRFSSLYGVASLQAGLSGRKSAAEDFAIFITKEFKGKREIWKEGRPEAVVKLKTDTVSVKTQFPEKNATRAGYPTTGSTTPDASVSRGATNLGDSVRTGSSSLLKDAVWFRRPRVGEDGVHHNKAGNLPGPDNLPLVHPSMSLTATLDHDEPSADHSSTPSTEMSHRERQLRSPEDSIGESQAHYVLNYCCRNILGADLKAIAESQLHYNNLIDLVEDFIADLTEATASGGHKNGSEPNASLGGNLPGTSSQLFPASFRYRQSADQDNGDREEPGGNDRQQPCKEPPISFKGKAVSLRLPCPLRMMFPSTFSVRTHYSCSMTYFPSIGRLKDHLREHHKRQDRAEVLCSRCFDGFRSRDELHRHSKAEIACPPGEFDPAIGLHGEAVNLLRGRDKAGQDYLTQWREVCKIVFQTDQIVPSPEYRAVVEHFEFVEVFFRSFLDLANIIHPPISSVYPHDMYMGRDFGNQVVDFFRKWYHLGLSTSGDPWSLVVDGIDPTDARFKTFHTVIDHCVHLLRQMAETSRNTLYENDSSRGNGGRSARRGENPPDRVPTSRASQTPSSLSTPYPQTPSVCPDSDSQRGQKRRRIAPPPALTPAPLSLATPRIPEEPEAVTTFPPATWAGAGETSPEQPLDGLEAASHNIGDLITLENLMENPSDKGQDSDAWLFGLEGWGDMRY